MPVTPLMLDIAEYQSEVISDCIRLGQDLVAEVKNGLQLFGFDVQLTNNPTFEPFMEEQKNTVTGVTFTLSLEVPWDWSACDIPAIWSVGGSSTGGSGTPYGIVLRTNGVDNAVQNILDLVAGTNITITDNGDGSVTFDASGGGGGGGDYVSTEWNANHTTAQGNPYQIGDRVWYNGSVYSCIANNDGINPSNPAYWTLVAVGYVATVVASAVAPEISAALTAASVAFAYAAPMLRTSSSKNAGDVRSSNSTENVCCPAYFLTVTDKKSDVISVSWNALPCAVSATAGIAVIFGISKVIPASGNTPRVIASIDGRIVVPRGLMISDN